MNRLTVQQRKMVYAGTALLLLIPIIILGAPPSNTAGAVKQGGQSYLAASREYHDLGEASLGDVDPTSATMNLVLLGMRGVAASVLWNQADYLKERKKFSELAETVESIILLQPHFKTVWRFQAWTLAYNVSAECDAVEDRYYWVKRGAKFLKRGVARNRLIPELPFDMGTFLGTKIGLADEHEAYQEFFLHDPDTKLWGGGPDEDLNRDGKDHYLVARDWYLQANEVLEHKGVQQHTMDLALFLAYPYRSLISYAKNLQVAGVTGDRNHMNEEQLQVAFQEWSKRVGQAWDHAYNEWVEIYGRTKFLSAGFGTLLLEDDARGLKELETLAKAENVTFEQKRDWQGRYRKMTSYPYWKMHCDIEKRELMTRARFHLAEGRRLYREVQDFEGAQANLEQGMSEMEQVIKAYQVNPEFNIMVTDEQEIIEESIKALLIWRQVKLLLDQPLPEHYPLKILWDDPSLEAIRQDLTARFQYWNGTL